MKPRSSIRLVTLVGLALSLATPAWAGDSSYQPDPAAPRSAIPTAYQWDPSDIFPSLEAWETEFKAVDAQITQLGQYKGRLGESGEILYSALDSTFNTMQRLYALYVYAQGLYDIDLGNDTQKILVGRVESMEPRFMSAVSYVDPEIVGLYKANPTAISTMIAATPKLKTYDWYVQNVVRMAPHTLSTQEENILALTGPLSSTPGGIHEALLDVDITFPEITDETGKKTLLTLSGFPKYRASPNAQTRREAAEAFFGTLRNYENTFATSLNAVVKAHIMTKEARGYTSCMEASLTPDNISTKTYNTLIETVHANLPRTMHKYIALRKKVLKLDGPVTFDNLYNPIFQVTEPTYTYDEARTLLPKALAPLGKDYVARLSTGLDPANGWIDVYPNADKRSGAYSNGSAYAVHPYVLHNYDNTMDALSTTAHEYGHALHSVYSNENQPFVYSNYTTFLAEVASTTNEELLLTYLLGQTRDPEIKLLLLNQRLEAIRTTIFRQTLFAEFEKKFHEQAETGEPLTATYLNETYAGLIRDFYGPDYAMGANDTVEWAFIPHFYYNFYVFSYATGLTSGISLARQIEKNPKAATRYIDNMLKAGNSAPPLDILRNAGVDLESPQPILDVMDTFEDTVDEFDKLYTKTYGKAKK